MNYYEINETAARLARQGNSYREYVAGSATDEYRRAVDEAAALVEKQKTKVDPMYHAKIDGLLDKYARRLADWYNRHFEIEARVPSIMISGGGNFPVGKKEKQNTAREKHSAEYKKVQFILECIKMSGRGGISSDDVNAIAKLETKLDGLVQNQEFMKTVNKHYRKHKTLDGCPLLSEDVKLKIEAAMSRDWRGSDAVPYARWALTNNNANISRVRERIAELIKKAESPAPDGWDFDGGRVVMNKDENRIQILFDAKPGEALRSELKSRGFRWAPSQGAWQRQLNDNGLYALKQIKAVQPVQN
jgi:hypothetical protein